MEKGGNDDGVSRAGDGAVDDTDPEVTAITRRFDSTGDTLGAINALEQLLIERTGQIPVVSPELLAAHAARIAQSEVQRAAEPSSGADASPEPLFSGELAIDWSIAAPAPLEPAPGFSPWIDPSQVAAAFDASAAHEFTDVSTKVFAVFSADRDEPVAAAAAAPEPAAELELDLEPGFVSEPVPLPVVVDDDKLEGIDDLAATSAEPAPMAAPAPAPAPASELASAPAPERRRRLWPFGRR